MKNGARRPFVRGLEAPPGGAKAADREGEVGAELHPPLSAARRIAACRPCRPFKPNDGQR